MPQKVVNFVSGTYAWTLNAQGQPVAQPDAAELRQIEILTTPYGFLKGAVAPGANPTMVTRREYDRRVTVVSFVALGKYRINGTINAQNMVQRTQTWIPNPVVGDLLESASVNAARSCARPLGRASVKNALEIIDDALERIEAECRGDRRTQVGVRVDVVEHAAAVRRLEVLDAADVEPGGTDDARRRLDGLARHLRVRDRTRPAAPATPAARTRPRPRPGCTPARGTG